MWDVLWLVGYALFCGVLHWLTKRAVRPAGQNTKDATGPGDDPEPNGRREPEHLSLRDFETYESGLMEARPLTEAERPLIRDIEKIKAKFNGQAERKRNG